MITLNQDQAQGRVQYGKNPLILFESKAALFHVYYINNGPVDISPDTYF